MTGNDYDITIVGAGPAGASAALHLARSGLRVLILDKARFPRYKACGGGLVYRALQFLPPGADQVVESSCLQADLFHHRPDMHFTTVRAEPIVSMALRDRLDAFLVDEACAAGARFQDRNRLLKLVPTASHLQLETEAGFLRTQFLIGADGARSQVAGLGGWGPPRALLPALETEVQVPDRVRKRFEGSARFDFGVIERGYAWVFPKAEQLSVGVATLTPRRSNLNSALTRYFEALGISERIQSVERHGSVLSLGPRPGGLCRDRILLVGDAAGTADPVTGEGISPALQSGQIAARALIEGDLKVDQVATAYSDGLKDLLKEIRLARALAPVLYRSRTIRTALFRRYGQRLSEAMTDIFLGRRTYSSILSEPRNYMKLLNV